MSLQREDLSNSLGGTCGRGELQKLQTIVVSMMIKLQGVGGGGGGGEGGTQTGTMVI